MIALTVIGVAIFVIGLIALNVWAWRNPPTPEQQDELDREMQIW